ncbi:HAMP domain-containing sensor histidine kinase [Antarctobacter sp.]|uniref:sensor histidine kinase n=1 Tax=Antarctobacter sp. TaxID=1872577 RepID=UPI002B27B75D|nr:HAMP domain-containing sensor histidine kinase [Antarctobacter sp.]
MLRRRKMSLKARLGGGAALLTAGTVLTAATLYVGMTRVSDRLETALAAEARIARYSILSTQVSTLLVVATEAVQSRLDAEARTDRIAPISRNIAETFTRLRSDLELAVTQVEALGLDAQSRYATQSLGLARMQALLDSTVRGLGEATTDADRLRAQINAFASGFDPLLNQAVNAEILFRNDILSGIERLRQALSLIALIIGALSILTALVFYLGLVRPQFLRLDRLRDAARQIGAENYAVALPETRTDEIGHLFSETNRMARALSQKEDAVRADRAALNETIDQRTAELRAANDQLAKTDETRRRFFADISHELRTPLTVILMEAQIGQKQQAEANAAFATIQDRAERLNRRIDDLLRVARSESGELALDLHAVDLAAILGQVAQDVAAECDSAGMRLEVMPAPALPATGDANWLRQVVAGLVSNAARHARDGGIIRLEPIEEPDFVGLSVSDNGPGVAAPDRATLFDRFARGSGSQGFGIGLALARWVIEAQSGTITLQSPLPRSDALGDGPGTKVSVRLPRRAP